MGCRHMVGSRSRMKVSSPLSECVVFTHFVHDESVNRAIALYRNGRTRPSPKKTVFQKRVSVKRSFLLPSRRFQGSVCLPP